MYLKKQTFRELHQKMLRKERTKQEMEDFQRQKRIWKEKQKIEIEEENQRIVEYCLEIEKKRKEAEKEKQRQAEERGKLNEKMVLDLTQIMVIII